MNKTNFQKICILSFSFFLIGTIFGTGIKSNENSIETEFTVNFSKPNIKYINNTISVTLPETNTILSHPNKPLLPIYKKPKIAIFQ